MKEQVIPFQCMFSHGSLISVNKVIYYISNIDYP